MRLLPLMRRWWSAPFVRAAVWGALGLAAVAGGVALAYELALARVPQHRATLERLVRAHTGLDVRFNELNVRWGWYGPEAVFHRVELGEPGRSNVLVRAPQLIVGFDAWRSVQTGQLQPGRITFVAPDVNLERPAAEAKGASGGDAGENRTRLLQRWRGGRIEFEGGTLRLPDPAGTADALALQIRRASLRRTQDSWSASALVFLPERLGHTARVAAQLEGDLGDLRSLQGTVRFDGLRLAFAGWRQVFGPASRVTRQLPASGSGDVSFRASFDQGRLEKADGRIRAQDLAFKGQPGFLSGEPQAGPAVGGLDLPRLRGTWRLAHRASLWQLRVEGLDLGAAGQHGSLPELSIDVTDGGAAIRGSLGDTPLATLAAVGAWMAPQLDLAGVELTGIGRDIEFDWDASRPPGTRLRATAQAGDVSLSPASRSFVLAGLDVGVAANESDVDIQVAAKQARLTMAATPDQPLDELILSTELRLSRREQGWHLSTPLLTFDRGATQLILSGSMTGAPGGEAPLLDLRATLVRAEISLLRGLLGEAATERFGAVAAHLADGRVERAQFQLQTRLERDTGDDAAPVSVPRLFAGSLALRGGKIAAGETWPEVDELAARFEWNGDRMSASVERGRSGSMEIEAAQARWSARAQREKRISGRARGRVEDAVQWLLAHPRLETYTPRLRDLAATGDALFDFDVTLPLPSRNAAADPKVRVTALLDGARLHLAQDLPAIQSVRGSLAFDSGRLQRSTLTGQWLGGPVALRISERRDRRGTALAVQAQGLLEARQLVALINLSPMPEVSGETPWNGELVYQPPDGGRPAQWQLDADASLIGVSSRLPDPLGKSVVTAVPLRVQAAGAGDEAEVAVSLGNRLKSRLALARAARAGEVDSGWQVARGAVSFGADAATVPSEPVIAVQGRLDRLDFPAYVSLWQRIGTLGHIPAVVMDLIAEQLWLAGRIFPGVRVQGRLESGEPAELSLASDDLNGSMRWPGPRPEVRLSAQSLDAAERARIVAQLEGSWDEPGATEN
jgi:uncharacterized protein YhdP